VQAERSASVGTGSANAVMGMVPTREPMMATPTSPLRIFFIVLSFLQLGLGANPTTYRHVDGCTILRREEKAVIAITLLAILFLRKTHENTQAAFQTFIIDQSDC
jgi:hypothetical protein